jgi:hypothetical protein
MLNNITETELKPLSLTEKIDQEKRKRNQAYKILDYQLSMYSYFDFFSEDAFIIAKQSKHFAYFLFEGKVVESLHLFSSFFFNDSELIQLLEKYGITAPDVFETTYAMKEDQEILLQKKEWEYISSTEKNITNNIKNLIQTKNWKLLRRALKETSLDTKNLVNFYEKQYSRYGQIINSVLEILELDTFFGTKKEKISEKEMKFGRTVRKIFFKASENAIFRFKSPVITSDILFLTMMEGTNTGAGVLIKRLLKNKTNWYLLRYEILKRIHYQESAIRSDVKKNQQFFAYLLKTELSENEFSQLIEKNVLQEAVMVFRNNLIQETVKLNFHKILERDVYASIKATSTRSYSKKE